MAEVGTAFLSIVPSMKGFAARLSSQTAPEADKAGKQAGTRFGSSFKGAFAALAVTGAATKFVSFMGDSARAASDLNETANKAKVIFGAQASEMNKWGNTAARTLGLSKQQALASAAGFGDMFRQLGFTGQASANMSKQVVQMSADLGSFNNLPTADVSDRISAAFRGEFDSLQALIPNINAARVEKEALAATGKKNAKSLTAQEKASAVLAIVQKDGARATGDFAKTSDQQANAAKIAGASLDDLKAKIGTALIPTLTKLALVATPAFEWLSKHQTTVTVFAAIIGTLLVGAFVAWTASIIAANIALLANPITWIIAAIIALIAVIVLIVKNWDLIKEKTAEVWDAVKKKIAAAWTSIKASVAAGGAAVLQWFRDLPTKIRGFLSRAGTWLLHVGEDIINGLIRGIGNGFQWVKNKITELGGNILSWARQILHIGSPSKLMADEVGRWIPAGIAMGIEGNADSVQKTLAGLTSDMAVSARVGMDVGTSGGLNSSGSLTRGDLEWHVRALASLMGLATDAAISDQLAFSGRLAR